MLTKRRESTRGKNEESRDSNQIPRIFLIIDDYSTIRRRYVPEDRRPPGKGSCDDTRRSTCHHIRWAGVGTGPGPRLRPHSSRVSAPGRSRTGTCQVGRLLAAPGAPSPGDRSRNRFRRSDASYLPSFHFSTGTTITASSSEPTIDAAHHVFAGCRASRGPIVTFHRTPPCAPSPPPRSNQGPTWSWMDDGQGETGQNCLTPVWSTVSSLSSLALGCRCERIEKCIRFFYLLSGGVSLNKEVDFIASYFLFFLNKDSIRFR